MPPVNQSTSEAGCEQQKQQQCQEGRVNDGAGGRAAKEASIDGGALRSPLDDADIFNSLFSKWGADDATEVSKGAKGSSDTPHTAARVRAPVQHCRVVAWGLQLSMIASTGCC